LSTFEFAAFEFAAANPPIHRKIRVHPAHALLNSTPQLFARDCGAVAQGAELGPGDLRMDAAAYAPI